MFSAERRRRRASTISHVRFLTRHVSTDYISQQRSAWRVRVSHLAAADSLQAPRVADKVLRRPGAPSRAALWCDEENPRALVSTSLVFDVHAAYLKVKHHPGG